MAVWDDFKLGVAGIGDAIGITDGAAAEVYATQTAAEKAGAAQQGETEQERAARQEALRVAIEAKAKAAEKNENIIGRAATQTATDIGKAAASVASGIGSGLFAVLKWPLILIGAALALFVALRFIPKR